MIGNSCLLDTSIIVDILRNSETAHKLNAYSTVFISSIVAGELFYGAYLSDKMQKRVSEVIEFISRCSILFPDVETAVIYGRTKAALKTKGKPIPENDIWIASIAIQHNLPLFTFDKHFQEVDSLLTIS